MTDNQKSFSQLLEELEVLRSKSVEMKKLEEQHVESKQILQKVEFEKQQYLDIAGVIFLVIDKDETIALLNKKGCKILEYTEAEALGKNWFDTCVPVWERERVRSIFRDLINGRTSHIEYAETVVVTRSGMEKIIAWHNTVIRDEEGAITATLSSGEEITERKRFEAALRESEEKYRTLVDNALIGIYKTSVNGDLLYANDAMVKMLGYRSLQEMMSHNVVGMYKNPDDRRRLLGEIRENGKVEEFEIEVITQTGEERDILISSYLENDVINGMFMDITERKKSEREKDRINAEMIQSQKMEAMGVVAEKAARDFSSLVATIQDSAAKALQFLGENDSAAEYIRTIQMEGARASSLTQQLLLVKGGEAGRNHEFSSGEMLASILPHIERITGGEITVCTDIASDAWNLKGDREEIELMIMNLVVNGRDAMREGGTLTLRLNNRILTEDDCRGKADARPGKFVEFAVSDEGPGIDPELIPHIFDPFFTTKDVDSSLGLGLSVVYGIAKQHDGWVKITTTRHAGSTFTIYLPAAV